MRFCRNDTDRVLSDASSMVWVGMVKWWGPPICVSSHTTVPTGPTQLFNLCRGRCPEASQLLRSGIPKPKEKKPRDISHFLSLLIAYIHRKDNPEGNENCSGVENQRMTASVGFLRLSLQTHHRGLLLQGQFCISRSRVASNSIFPTIPKVTHISGPMNWILRNKRSNLGVRKHLTSQS